MELLRDLHKEGATICMVTHDPRFAKHAQREVHLFDGKVVAEEELKEVDGKRGYEGLPFYCHSESSEESVFLRAALEMRVPHFSLELREMGSEASVVRASSPAKTERLS